MGTENGVPGEASKGDKWVSCAAMQIKKRLKIWVSSELHARIKQIAQKNNRKIVDQLKEWTSKEEKTS